ncbi:ribbon-helix-helix protein, CopG family [Streptomyces sp. S1]|uniref:ribbon-helix-helix protein, CopG family n=1 Tax=Streptomyces sp. S1 TaxID=718288 RepID=UPI003D71BAC5
MSTDASPPGRRELRVTVTVTDEVYEQLQALAADSRVRSRSTPRGCSPTTSPAPGSSPTPTTSAPTDTPRDRTPDIQWQTPLTSRWQTTAVKRSRSLVRGHRGRPSK